MTGHIFIYGIIGTAPKGATEKYYSFEDFQREITGDFSDYIVHIISPGGDVFQGQAIYNALVNTGKKIKVQIEGVCASIATLIAGAASPGELVMQENSQFMVHNPKFTSIGGDANQLRTGAVQLDQIKSLLISVYRQRTGMSEAELWKLYDQETWMLPAQAKQMGFVDDVVPAHRAVAFADFNNLNDMENQKTILDAIADLGKKITGLFRPKNMTETLQDGRVIMVETEDGDWTGKRVTLQEGGPLEPGEYTLASGKKFTVGPDSTITEVMEPQPTEQDQPEDMETKKKLEAAEARIKELESALETRNDAAAKAEARATAAEIKIKTDLKAVQDELEKIKTTTVGDHQPDRGAKLPVGSDGSPLMEDPMKSWYKKNIFDVRNTD